MSEATITHEALQDSAPRVGGAPPAPAPAPVSSAAAGAAVLWRIGFALLALIALAALLLALSLWQKVSGMQEQLARQSADALSQSTEARTLARQAQEVVRDTAARLALTETRIGEVALQRSQLDDLMQSLSRSRDDNLVVDIDATVRLALQQAQVTGNVQPLLATLRAADQRIARAAQPRLAPLQRAMQRDADRLSSSPGTDNGEALHKIDDLIRNVDELPPLNAVGPRSGATEASQIEAPPADAAWWQRLLFVVRNEARSLLRVNRIDRPEAVLLTPEQTFFLRENLKLKLLNVRLALLSRQADTARTDMNSVAASINRYFDPASRRVQSAATLVQQIQSQIRSSEPPRIDDTLAALANAAAGH